MATPPSDSRQPPDGDEFPDFVDNDNEIIKYSTPIGYRTIDIDKQMNNTMEDLSKPKVPEINSKPPAYLNKFETTLDVHSNKTSDTIPIHTRSQSLGNLSTINPTEKTEQKSSRWNDLVEQRRKSLSKLKGLVIPETKEIDVPSSIDPAINIPEIKNLDTAAIFSLPKITNNLSNAQVYPVFTPKQTPPVTAWTSNTTSSLPKYSPAFKRKSLHVYTTSINKTDQIQDTVNTEMNKYYEKVSPRPNKLTDEDLNPPKSLESISSPTKSDCSFDYNSFPKKNNESVAKTACSILEDESDNDSAVSSSQSSFNSRFSPPASPTKSFQSNSFKRKEENDKNSQGRFLPASSTEAINRRNILASAKCSSGNKLANLESVQEIPPLKKVEETPPVDKSPPVEKIKTVTSYSDVNNESSPWESRNTTPVRSSVPDRPIRRELARSIESLPETGSALKTPAKSYTERSLKSKEVPTTELSNLPAKDLSPVGTTNSYLSSRKPKPVSVKTLMQNFEKFGASQPLLPQKPIVTRTQIAKSVKNEILKAEMKIHNSNEMAVTPSTEIRSKRTPNKVMPLEIRKSEENLATEKFGDKMTTETITLKLNNESVLGISITGGLDENTDVMVHRIRYGSVAYQDGRLKKGDKLISINGKPTKGLTYAEAVELLKEQKSQFVIERQETDTPYSGNLQRRSSSLLSIDSKSLSSVAAIEVSTPKTPTHVISFSKDGSGLGFSIEGGKDSPQGDVPLIIKKIFTGGAADKNGELLAGDEIIFVNDINFTNLTRIEAWNMMKKIPDGVVKIQVYRKS